MAEPKIPKISGAHLKKLIALKNAAEQLRVASVEKKNAVLTDCADLLLAKQAELLQANAKDMKLVGTKESAAFLDRLLLTQGRIQQLAASLREVATLHDPLSNMEDKDLERRILENGILLRKVRAPLGVIFLIFESRPNVAIESFSLAFKSGNVLILRGGKESMRTTKALYAIIEEALEKNGFSQDCIWGITHPSRDLVRSLLAQRKWIDVVIPRGGEALIDFVVSHSRIPIIKNDRGMCHAYVHRDADIEMAVNIVDNGKCQRPGVCNALETVLVHKKVALPFITSLYNRMLAYKVTWYGCAQTRNILRGKPHVKPATSRSWDTEYLDLRINCRVVESLDEAIAHIAQHGSGHSEAIITANEKDAREFQSRIDAAAVYWNVSTRFTDGFEFGLGGEIGISTQKLHVRGPVGLDALTSARWIIDGTGQTRT